MNGELLVFLLLAFGIFTGAVLILMLRNVVHALLSAVAVFVSISGMYILLTAEFVAGVQLLIYSGAISILLLFAIMLTKAKGRTAEKGNRGMKLAVFLTVFGLAAVIVYGIRNLRVGSTASFHENNTEQIGELLFTKYIIPFELTSIVLLVALVGAIILAKREEN